MGFNTTEAKSIGNFLSHTYVQNKEYIDNFYDNLMAKNWNECLKSIDTMPDEVKDIISKRATSQFLLSVENILSSISTQFKIAFGHVNELISQDPTKAAYIGSLAIIGMLVSYLFGKRAGRK